MKTINIGLLGCGTVGTGVAKLLIENQSLITSRIGAVLVLKRVADIDINRDRGIQFDKGVFTTDPEEIISDPDIRIVIELIGGKGIAKDLILKAIDNGKQIVTANKALLADSGTLIFDAAEKKGVDLAFEAGVAGCIPIIKTLRESLAADRIKSITGILNGTCNYILSKCTESGITFEDALKEAQAKGFAEADPTLDVEGIDTAHKLAILTSIAYGTEINLDQVYVKGISNITPVDIECAKFFDCKIKLLAISKCHGDTIEARVHPAMVPCDNILASVGGSMNAVQISGEAVGDMVLYGHGAGMMPTANAVLSDTIDLARNILNNSGQRIPFLSYQHNHVRHISVLPIEKISTCYYFRFSVHDRAGVLAKISSILGNYNISLKSVNQKGERENGSITIVMTTHLAEESNVRQALYEISRLDIVTSNPVLIRIEGK